MRGGSEKGPWRRSELPSQREGRGAVIDRVSRVELGEKLRMTARSVGCEDEDENGAELIDAMCEGVR